MELKVIGATKIEIKRLIDKAVELARHFRTVYLLVQALQTVSRPKPTTMDLRKIKDRKRLRSILI